MDKINEITERLNVLFEKSYEEAKDSSFLKGRFFEFSNKYERFRNQFNQFRDDIKKDVSQKEVSIHKQNEKIKDNEFKLGEINKRLESTRTFMFALKEEIIDKLTNLNYAFNQKGKIDVLKLLGVVITSCICTLFIAALSGDLVAHFIK